MACPDTNTSLKKLKPVGLGTTNIFEPAPVLIVKKTLGVPSFEYTFDDNLELKINQKSNGKLKIPAIFYVKSKQPKKQQEEKETMAKPYLDTVVMKISDKNIEIVGYGVVQLRFDNILGIDVCDKIIFVTGTERPQEKYVSVFAVVPLFNEFKTRFDRKDRLYKNENIFEVKRVKKTKHSCFSINKLNHIFFVNRENRLYIRRDGRKAKRLRVIKSEIKTIVCKSDIYSVYVADIENNFYNFDYKEIKRPKTTFHFQLPCDFLKIIEDDNDLYILTEKKLFKYSAIENILYFVKLPHKVLNFSVGDEFIALYENCSNLIFLNKENIEEYSLGIIPLPYKHLMMYKNEFILFSGFSPTPVRFEGGKFDIDFPGNMLKIESVAPKINTSINSIDINTNDVNNMNNINKKKIIKDYSLIEFYSRYALKKVAALKMNLEKIEKLPPIKYKKVFENESKNPGLIPDDKFFWYGPFGGMHSKLSTIIDRLLKKKKEFYGEKLVFKSKYQIKMEEIFNKTNIRFCNEELDVEEDDYSVEDGPVMKINKTHRSGF